MPASEGPPSVARCDHLSRFYPPRGDRRGSMELTPGETRRGEGKVMWDTVSDNDQHLSHDLPCPRCGHAMHTYLVCDERCDCAPCEMPGSHLLSARGR